MAETGRHTNTVSGKRRPQNVYVDGNTVRKVQEVPERREYRQPEHSVRKNKAKPELTTPEQQVRGNKPLSKAARRNRAKANNMNRNFAIFLAALGILIVFCSINYLKLKTECTSKRSQLATLESQLAELKEDNDAYESQVTSSVDLERIRKIAIGRLGMKYPSNQQTETYATEGGSYVRQYQDVTGSNGNEGRCLIDYSEKKNKKKTYKKNKSQYEKKAVNTALLRIGSFNRFIGSYHLY